MAKGGKEEVLSSAVVLLDCSRVAAEAEVEENKLKNMVGRCQSLDAPTVYRDVNTRPGSHFYCNSAVALTSTLT